MPNHIKLKIFTHSQQAVEWPKSIAQHICLAIPLAINQKQQRATNPRQEGVSRRASSISEKKTRHCNACGVTAALLSARYITGKIGKSILPSANRFYPVLDFTQYRICHCQIRRLNCWTIAQKKKFFLFAIDRGSLDPGLRTRTQTNRDPVKSISVDFTR